MNVVVIILLIFCTLQWFSAEFMALFCNDELMSVQKAVTKSQLSFPSVGSWHPEPLIQYVEGH